MWKTIHVLVTSFACKGMVVLFQASQVQSTPLLTITASTRASRKDLGANVLKASSSMDGKLPTVLPRA